MITKYEHTEPSQNIHTNKAKLQKYINENEEKSHTRHLIRKCNHKFQTLAWITITQYKHKNNVQS